MKKKRFRNFISGFEPEGANVRVLCVMRDGRRQTDVLYEVKMLCCGVIRRRNHSAIRKRMLDRPRFCEACKPNHGNEPLDRFITGGPDFGHGPAWPVPPSALAAHLAGWEGR